MGEGGSHLWCFIGHTTHAHSQVVVSMCLIVVCLFVCLLKKRYGIINRDMVLTFTLVTY